MATSSKPPLNAFNTALVLMPPREIALRLNPFRMTHDKAGLRWPAHITMIFPFVEPMYLPETISNLKEAVKTIQPFQLCLDKVGKFPKKDYDTVHLTIGKKSDQQDIQALWKALAATVGYQGRPFAPHLTLGQASTKRGSDSLQFLNEKAELMLERVRYLDWRVGSVVVLRKDENDGGVMKLYDEIFLEDHTQSAYQPAPFWTAVALKDQRTWDWENESHDTSLIQTPSNLSVATYNLLHDPDFPTDKRLDQLTSEIAGANADVLCLQEVTEESLDMILGSGSIQSSYPFSSRHPMTTMENERNILILSRYPFQVSVLDTSTKHKPAYIAEFPFSSPLVLAAIHLTAGRAASPLEQKTKELVSVVKHLETNYSTAEWVIAGDLNWPNEIDSTPADRSLFDVGQAGGEATYDPTRNSLAAKTARESKVGQRYDRIFVKRNGAWKAKEIEVFGISANPASDHWGLKATLHRDDSTSTGNRSLPVAESNALTSGVSQLPELSLSTSEVLVLLEKERWMPTEEQEDAMKKALSLVQQTICDSSSNAAGTSNTNVIIRVEPVGSYALGVHTRSSDIDCVAVGNLSPKTFWQLARFRIRTALTKAQAKGETDVVLLRRFVKDAAVQMMELEACGVKVDLQYCAASKLAESWEDVPNLPSDSPLFSLPLASLVTLNAYRDVITIKKTVPSLDAFRTAHRALKLFLIRRGIWGARFGYLGGFHLTLLLTRVALSLPLSATPSHLIESFIKTYAQWDWARDMVYPLPSREKEQGSNAIYKRILSKEPMVVLSIERPLSNLTYHASQNSVDSLSRNLKEAHTMLTQGKTLCEICYLTVEEEVSPKTGPLKELTSHYKSFVRLDVHFWGGNCMKGRALVGWLESRIVNFLVHMKQAAPETITRFWPQRLVDESTLDTSSRDLQGFYLFGLGSVGSSSSEVNVQDPSTEAAVLNCIRSFERDLRGTERFYDPADTFISLTYVKKRELPPNLLPDPFVWSDNGVDSPDADEEEDIQRDLVSPEVANQEEMANPEESWEDFKPISAAQRKRAAASSKSKSTPHIASGKLRTSSDVYNRLMWDTTGPVSKDGYLIGYEDRFLGVKEAPLTSWKREVEDESFIPFHRVVYFKRVSDGVHVWDRRTKVDLVFGSGVGSG